MDGLLLSQKKEKVGIACWLTCMYLICMPLSIVSLPFGFSLLKLLSYMIGGIFICMLFIGKTELRLNIVHLFLALYLVYSVSNLLQLHDENSWENIRGIIETTFIMFLISSRVYNKKEKNAIMITWMLVGAISTLMAFTSSEQVGEERSTLLIWGGIEDPNQFCGYFVLPLMLYMEQIVKKSKLTPLYIALILVIIYAVFKTGSRGGLIAVLMAIFAFVMIYAKGIKSKLKIMISLAIVAVIFMYTIYPVLPEDLRQRFTVQSVQEDRGSGRFDLWKATIDAVTKNDLAMIFGNGIGSTVGILTKAGYKNTVAHNHWLQIWCDQGFIGAALFLMIILSGGVRCFKKRTVISVSLIGMLALSMSLTLYATYKTFWNILLMASMNFEEETQDEGQRGTAGLRDRETPEEMLEQRAETDAL